MRFFLCIFNKNDGNYMYFLVILSILVIFLCIFFFHFSQKPTKHSWFFSVESVLLKQ